jgi:hypothetical protein
VPKKFQPLLDAILHQHPGIHDPVALIRAGRVFADGTPVTNPAARVAADATITVRPPRPLRGTLKLQAAPAVFDCTIAGRVALDIGASTGGFTVALLEAGARHVYALDAGHGQLLGSLRQDPRVTNLERTNLADLRADRIPEPVEVVTLDLSYLAIADAIPQLGVLTLARDAELLASSSQCSNSISRAHHATPNSSPMLSTGQPPRSPLTTGESSTAANHPFAAGAVQSSSSCTPFARWRARIPSAANPNPLSDGPGQRPDERADRARLAALISRRSVRECGAAGRPDCMVVSSARELGHDWRRCFERVLKHGEV